MSSSDPKKNKGFAVINVRANYTSASSSSSSSNNNNNKGGSSNSGSNSTYSPSIAETTGRKLYQSLTRKSASTLATLHSEPRRTGSSATATLVPLDSMRKSAPQTKHTSADSDILSLTGNSKISISSSSSSGRQSRLFLPKKKAPAIPIGSKRTHGHRVISYPEPNIFDTPQPVHVNTSICLSVYYAAEGLWKNVSFPPSITVGQARDICMLRFNVWQHVMEREIPCSNHSLYSTSSGIRAEEQQQQQWSKADDNASETGRGSVHTEKTSISSTGSTRDQFGLYWVARSKWLDSHMHLAGYGFKEGDIIELQDRYAFVYTNNRVTNIHQEIPTVSAEGPVYYLETKGIEAAWRLRWLVLRSQMLRCYRKKGDGGDRRLLEIDLDRGFKLVDQNGQEDHKVSTSDRLSDDSGDKSTKGTLDTAAVGLSALLGLASRQQLGGDGAPLIIKSGRQVHIFCTQSAVDYDYWRRMLRLAQGSPVGESGVASSRDQEGGSWTTETHLAATASWSKGSVSTPSTSSTAPSIPLPKIPWQQRHSTLASAPEAGSSFSGGVGTSLVHHRPRQQAQKQPRLVARPSVERFVATAYRRRPNMPSLELCHCVTVSGGLYGFSDMDICSEIDNENLVAFADFMVGLKPGSVAVSSEAHGDRHVIRLLGADPSLFREVASSSHASRHNQQGRLLQQQSSTDFSCSSATGNLVELLWLEVGSKERSRQWVEALCTIGGIWQHQKHSDLDSASLALLEEDARDLSAEYAAIDHDLHEMILRRSKSVVSTISRAEWPMPPTTVPPMPKWVSSLQPPPSPPRAEERPSRHAMASDSWLGVSSTRTVDGNPSLDAVGRRFNDTGSIREGHGGSSASSPFARFPWFKQRGSAPR